MVLPLPGETGGGTWREPRPSRPPRGEAGGGSAGPPTPAPAPGTETTEATGWTAPEGEFSVLPLGLGWEGSVFTGDPGKRFCWILFIFVTYRLAFGRNDAGEYHVEAGVNSAVDLYGRGYGYRQEPKKTRAVLRANLAGVTVARRSSKRTTRRSPARDAAAKTERKLERSRTATRGSSGAASREAPAKKQTAEDQVAKQRAAKRGRDKAEARQALMNLGYNRAQANQMLVKAGEQNSPEAYIQAALRERGKNLDAAGRG